MARDIKLPDIGDFKDVPIIEIHIKPGQTVAKEDVILTLESDKATLEVPSPEAGVIGEIKVKVGDKVSQGSLLATIEGAAIFRAVAKLPRRRKAPAPPASAPAAPRAARRTPALPPAVQRRRSRPISNATSSSSAPAPAAIPPPSGRPISGRKSSSSTGARRWAAYASISAASRRRLCCMRPM